MHALRLNAIYGKKLFFPILVALRKTPKKEGILAELKPQIGHRRAVKHLELTNKTVAKLAKLGFI